MPSIWTAQHVQESLLDRLNSLRDGAAGAFGGHNPSGPLGWI